LRFKDPEDPNMMDDEGDSKEKDKNNADPPATCPQVYERGNVCLIRPPPESPEKYWIGRLMQDIDTRSAESVEVWWYQSFAGKTPADNPSAGHWQAAYRNRKPYKETISTLSLDMIITLSENERISSACLKEIHKRILFWRRS
jgi:hypothetical protein